MNAPLNFQRLARVATVFGTVVAMAATAPEISTFGRY